MEGLKENHEKKTESHYPGVVIHMLSGISQLKKKRNGKEGMQRETAETMTRAQVW